MSRSPTHDLPRFTENEEVAVNLPGLRQSLYGRVVRQDGLTITVTVFRGEERARMTVDADLVRPWFTRGSGR
ncbi:MAG TPA: hypothetical protein VE326_11335 [Candidatus Binatia bacterium]|nr:hypothetical protein [Candidatus Binatia bacterium]